MHKKLIIFFVLASVLAGCNKNKPPEINLTYSFINDRLFLNATSSTDPEGDPINLFWSTNDGTLFSSEGLITSLRYSFEHSGEEILLTLNAFDGENESQMEKEILIHEFLTEWGLTNPIRFKRNDIISQWYFTQKNTGTHSDDNCGPTTATMAVKWYDKDYEGTPEIARQKYKPSGGWWYTDDIINFLDDNFVYNAYIRLEPNLQNLTNELEKGNIAILCIDAYYLTPNLINYEYHIDFPYNVEKDFGHFIIVKGFIETNEEFFFEVYDPGSYHSFNDGSWIGENRYYRRNDIIEATENWWGYAIIVSKQPLKSTLNKDNIPANWGK